MDYCNQVDYPDMIGVDIVFVEADDSPVDVMIDGADVTVGDVTEVLVAVDDAEFDDLDRLFVVDDNYLD